MNPALLLHTVRYLKPSQIAHRLARRIPRRPNTPAVEVRERRGSWVDPICYEPSPLVRPSRLRTYTLHYHHRLTAAQALDWIAENPPACGPGWDPYPLSRRIVNWVKWLHPMPPAAIASLAIQADYLSRTVEYDVLANHLMANAKALIFAGAFYQAGGWLHQGLSILEREIAEQILADGGHFERSPMYHAVVLEDLLDLINLGRTYPGLLGDFSGAASRMLGWLDSMTHPDREISFFNDSAFGVAPSPSELHAYARRLGLDAVRAPLSDSGYIRLENRDSVVLFDAAPIGPDYQPAHAHADTLSFEYSHGGRRLVVNSGISTYTSGQERWYQRGTAAHNTVRLDGRDSSEVWSAFRVARRARPLAVRTDGASRAEAGHDGYKPTIHFRTLDLGRERLVVYDRIEGTGRHQIEVLFHLHPGVDPEMVRLDPALARKVELTTFHPRFDQSLPNLTVVGRFTGSLPVFFSTVLSNQAQ